MRKAGLLDATMVVDQEAKVEFERAKRFVLCGICCVLYCADVKRDTASPHCLRSARVEGVIHDDWLPTISRTPCTQRLALDDHAQPALLHLLFTFVVVNHISS